MTNQSIILAYCYFIEIIYLHLLIQSLKPWVLIHPGKKGGNLGFKKSKWAKLFIKDFEIIIHLFVSRSLKSKVALKIQSFLWIPKGKIP